MKKLTALFITTLLTANFVWAQATEEVSTPAPTAPGAATESVNQPADGSIAKPNEEQKKSVAHAAKKAKKAKKAKHKKAKKKSHKKNH